MKKSYTDKQGQYLAFIYCYGKGLKFPMLKSLPMTSVISRAVRELEQEIARLQQALNILRSVSGTRARRGARRRPRKLSAEARKWIASAQRARWARWKAKAKLRR